MKALIVAIALLSAPVSHGDPEGAGSVEFLDEKALRAPALMCTHPEPRRLLCMELGEFLRRLEQETGKKFTPPPAGKKAIEL